MVSSDVQPNSVVMPVGHMPTRLVNNVGFVFTDILVGEAELSLLNDKRLTEGRHVLPLTGSSHSHTTYGSLTVEVK